jgi:N terminus of Rad21 / Rec8 like protein/Conserved region of Rad21 / Rec8 like protein
MFYSEHILTKKGPLAKIWLAAHMHNKLTKAMVFSTNITSAVTRIIAPDAPMALRLTSNLLLGVVRIFSRKTKYLAADASDAVARLKLAYTASSTNDLPEDAAHGSRAAITISAHGVDPLDDLLAQGSSSALDLDFPSSSNSRSFANKSHALRDSNTAADVTPRYLADAREITIDEYAGGLSGGIMDAFGPDPDLDLLPVDEPERDRRAFRLGAASQEEEENDCEPLIFTPSQQRNSSAASTPRRASSLGSVERMRDAPVGAPGLSVAGGGTPRLSFGDIDVTRTGDPNDGGAGGSIRGPSLTPLASAEKIVPRSLVDEDDLENVRPNNNFASPYDDGGANVSDAADDDQALFLPADDLVLSDNADTRALLARASLSAAISDGGDNAVTHVDGGPADTIALRPRGARRGASMDIHAANTNTESDEGVVDLNEEKERENTVDDNEGPLVTTAEYSRKRKALLSHMDKETELSANFFRECLQDTSDIVRPQKRACRGADDSERGLTAMDIFCRPVFSGLAPELNMLFASCFDREQVFRDPGSPVSEPPRHLSQPPRSDSLSALEGPADGNASNSESDVEVSRPHRPQSCLISAASAGSMGMVASPKPPSRVGENDESTERLMTPLPPIESVEEDADCHLLSLSAGGSDLPLIDDAGMPMAGMHQLSPREEAQVLVPLRIENPEQSQVPVQHNVQVSGDEYDEAGDNRSNSMKITLAEVAHIRVQLEATSGGDEGVNVGGGYPAGSATMTSRSLKMRDLLAQQKRDDDGSICFSKILDDEPGVTRRVAARTFYELLNLCSKNVVSVGQTESYGTISVVPLQPAFDTIGKRSDAAAAPAL